MNGNDGMVVCSLRSDDYCEKEFEPENGFVPFFSKMVELNNRRPINDTATLKGFAICKQCITEVDYPVQPFNKALQSVLQREKLYGEYECAECKRAGVAKKAYPLSHLEAPYFDDLEGRLGRELTEDDVKQNCFCHACALVERQRYGSRFGQADVLMKIVLRNLQRNGSGRGDKPRQVGQGSNSRTSRPKPERRHQPQRSRRESRPVDESKRPTRGKRIAHKVQMSWRPPGPGEGINGRKRRNKRSKQPAHTVPEVPADLSEEEKAKAEAERQAQLEAEKQERRAEHVKAKKAKRDKKVAKEKQRLLRRDKDGDQRELNLTLHRLEEQYSEVNWQAVLFEDRIDRALKSGNKSGAERLIGQAKEASPGHNWSNFWNKKVDQYKPKVDTSGKGGKKSGKAGSGSAGKGKAA